jgi:hypothetical protein
MELRCKVFRSAQALDLEEAINRFLHEELIGAGEVQFEEITQSEGPDGVTIVVWYSIADAELMEEEIGDEVDGGEPRELA